MLLPTWSTVASGHTWWRAKSHNAGKRRMRGRRFWLLSGNYRSLSCRFAHRGELIYLTAVTKRLKFRVHQNQKQNRELLFIKFKMWRLWFIDSVMYCIYLQEPGGWLEPPFPKRTRAERSKCRLLRFPSEIIFFQGSRTFPDLFSQTLPYDIMTMRYSPYRMMRDQSNIPVTWYK